MLDARYWMLVPIAIADSMLDTRCGMLVPIAIADWILDAGSQIFFSHPLTLSSSDFGLMSNVFVLMSNVSGLLSFSGLRNPPLTPPGRGFDCARLEMVGLKSSVIFRFFYHTIATTDYGLLSPVSGI
jgi:hypothetical protein